MIPYKKIFMEPLYQIIPIRHNIFRLLQLSVPRKTTPKNTSKKKIHGAFQLLSKFSHKKNFQWTYLEQIVLFRDIFSAVAWWRKHLVTSNRFKSTYLEKLFHSLPPKKKINLDIKINASRRRMLLSPLSG